MQFGGPIKQFDIRTKLSLEFMVGLTTLSPGAKGLVKLNHLCGITTCKCIADVFIIFSQFLTFSLIFMKIQNIIYISDYAMKGLYLSFNLVSSLVV